MPPQSDTTSMRVSPSSLRSLRALATQLEALAHRRVLLRDALRVAIVAAENTEDETLAGYLDAGERSGDELD